MRIWKLTVLGLLGTVGIAGIAQALTIVDPGTTELDVRVRCGNHVGRVKVNSGVHIRQSELVERENAVSISFHATQGNALECAWVQFVWEEIVYTINTPGGQLGQLKMAGSLQTTAGEMQLTTDSTAPNWIVDSAAKSSPVYAVNNASINDSSGTQIFDQPGSVVLAAAGLAALPPGFSLAKVEDITHFETYLVCNGAVCYRVVWTVAYTWTPAPGGSPVTIGPVYSPKPTGAPASALRPAQKATLTTQYPGQTTVTVH